MYYVLVTVGTVGYGKLQHSQSHLQCCSSMIPPAPASSTVAFAQQLWRSQSINQYPSSAAKCAVLHALQHTVLQDSCIIIVRHVEQQEQQQLVLTMGVTR